MCARELHSLEALVSEIRAAGHEARAYRLDVTQVASIEPVIQQIYRDFGRLDILMNNAGLGDNQTAVDVTESDWDRVFAVNAKGLFFVAQAAGKVFLQQRYGRIVNMSSQASVVGIRDHAVYCASKGAVNQLTKVLALEWAPSGVTVNAIGPTFIHTPGTADRLNEPAYFKAVIDRIPAGRVGTIADVAAAALFLSSPAASLITGQHLAIDGGWTAQ